MHYLKQIVGIIAVVLTFIAYVPYYRGIIKGKVHPHIYSWTLWTLLTVLIVALQIKGGAGIATLVTASAGLLCVGVVTLGLKYGKRDITRSDTIVALLALVAMAFWLIADQPIVSIIFAVAADLLAFIPTVRKSWHKPHSETISFYLTNTVRFSLALFAVQQYTILSSLWLAAWAIANGLFCIMLAIRRKQKSIV